MPQYIALKTFKGKFGAVHRGMTYTLPESDGRDLMRNGLVRPIPERQAPRNAAIAEAPSTAGEDSAGQPGDGLGKPSSASHPAPRSRRRIASTSKGEPK